MSFNTDNYSPHLKNVYYQNIVPFLMDKYGLKNTLSVPKLTKIVVSTSFGKYASDSKRISTIFQELGQITGQMPVKCLSKKSIAVFNLRKGMCIGCKVTLRNDRMYEFIDKLIVALPRIRDFQGLSSRSFDGYGGYSLGIKEQVVFHEINYNKVTAFWGMNVTLFTNAGSGNISNNIVKDILCMLYFPFKN